MLTFEEVCERLEEVEETDLLGYLGLTSTDLVNSFKDKIESNIEYYARIVEDDLDDDSPE